MKTICLYFEIHQIIHLKRYRFFDILLEKGKATHSSVLTLRIPWTEGPGGLQTMWLQRV